MPLKDWNDPAVWWALYAQSAEAHPDIAAAGFTGDHPGRPGKGRGGRPSYRRGIYLHYERPYEVPWHVRYADWLVNTFGMVDDGGNGVAVIGAGYGWTPEKLLALRPLGSVAATDTSQFIHDTINQSGAQALRDDAAAVQAEMIAGGFAADSPEVLDIDPAGTYVSELIAFHGLNGVRLGFNVLQADISTGGGRAAVRGQIQGARKLTDVVSENVLEGLDDAEAVAFSDDCLALPQQVGGTIMHLVSTTHSDPEFNIKPLADWQALFTGAGQTVTMLDSATFEVG